MNTEDISVKHQFTTPELAQMGREQAGCLDRLAMLEAELDSVKKQYGAQIVESKAAVMRISTRVHAGWEMRNVLCLIIDDRPAEGFRIVVRTDNGQVVKRRRLDNHERQMTLTTEPKEFIASALLPVDGADWDVEAAEVLIYDDEFEILRKIDAVKIQPYRRPGLRLHDSDGNAKNAERHIPTDPNAPEWRTEEERLAGVPHHQDPPDAVVLHDKNRGKKK